ncbi:spermidine/putrescine transport system ATP-binding protein [Tistlia consotensis]|uniref:Spermidine/putrescine import ATP-binding protein PotA n=1 Tax=Tistlia consotensis USBA 355 TaxID=560819 RepID=A0A1Y6CHB9_9PROT|nr:ABC transporter ATP-binding protein [Tistlia consotensis]SMF65340.1 spermidine/putrescine transport system ATP-binding protein [Tistlia consotensis USBA 355]SNS03869.1 spermidine/putrescine transport system ATP-binding protein [Tistlia consotensis]
MTGDGAAADRTAGRSDRAGAAAIEIRRVRKVFGSGQERAVVALDDVSLTIRDNEFFTLLGPSGCGKTTLLRLIAGFEQPTAGEILLFGSHLEHLPPHRRPVNTVFQQYALFPHMTVAENIGFGLMMQGRPKREIDETVRRMLALVRMDDLAGRRTDQLSGGQQQRVALARALAPHPKVLLLDEPLSALDLKLRKEMQIELKRLQHETGITFIFVTHDQEEALTMSDRIAVMSDGAILQVGTPREIYDHPARRFVADFIGEINILPAELLETREASGGASARVRLSSGQVRLARLPDGPVAAGRVNVAVRPEHAGLQPAGEGAALTGTLSNVVYFGTGTHYHLELDGPGGEGGRFVVELQNRLGAGADHAIGARLGILLTDGSLQVLCD